MATDPPAFARPRPGTQPPPLYPDYASTQKRAPKRPPIRFEHTLSETTGPVFEGGWAGPDAADLTRQHKGAPLRSEEHTSELQSPYDLVCRLLLEKKKNHNKHKR